jgi:hypothetical protein
VKGKREQQQAELMAAAKLAIDEALDWDGRAEAPTLTEIEEVILRLRKEFGQRKAEVLLGGQEAKKPVPGPECATCQREMSYKGMKETGVETRLGPLGLERGYYYCDHCRVGLFPPGSTTGAVGETLE